MTDIPSRSFGSNLSWFCKWYWPAKFVQYKFSFAKPGLLDRLQHSQRSEYEGYFSAADAAFWNGWVDSAQKGRKTCWKNWCYFVRPLWVEPWIQDTTYQQRVQCLTGFADCVRLGRYGWGKQVAIGTVSGALSDVGMTVALAYEVNPTKSQCEKHLVPQLAQMMERWRKEDPPTKKKSPVGIDVPEFLAELRM